MAIGKIIFSCSSSPVKALYFVVYFQLSGILNHSVTSCIAITAFTIAPFMSVVYIVNAQMSVWIEDEFIRESS
jgi:hypothetical protein